MLLVCPDCSHRYRIPDDRGADGRVLRFACRACGTSIDSREHLEAERLGEGPGWLVIHEGTALGPFDTRALVGLARSRTFGPRALVWRDGADGWNVAGNTPPLGPERSVAWWVKIGEAEVDGIVAGLGQVLAARTEHQPSIDALEKMVRVGRGGAVARDLLASALRAVGDLRRLVELLDDQLSMTDGQGERVELRRRIGGLYEALGEPAAAAAAYDEALRDAPHELGLLEGLIRVGDGDWAALIRRLEAALAGLDPADGARLRLRIARIRADELGDPEAALTALDTVETHVAGAEARALRIELYRRLARWPALAALHAEIAGETTGAERRESLRGLAELLADELADPHAAARTWATIADEWPADDDAVERLAALVGGHPDLADEAETLDRTLVARDDWPGVYALRAQRIGQVPAGSLRAGAMAALAGLCIERLSDPQAAFTWAARAVLEQPHVEDYRRLHAELARLADRLPSWVDAAVVAFEADPALADVYVEAAVSMPLVDVDRERLHRAVLRVDPSHGGAFAVLHAMCGAFPTRLHTLLDARIALDPADRRALLIERATLESGPLDDADAAWSTWGAILAVDPLDALALRARLALAERLDRARLLAATDALRQALPAGAERAALDRAAARLAADLGQPSQAITRWWQIFDDADRAGQAEALTALVDLCRAAGDTAGLIRALETRRDLDGASTSADLRALAELYTAAADDRAVTCWRTMLARDPRDVGAQDGLAAASDDPIDLFNVAVLRLARAEDKGAGLTALVSLADPVVGDLAGLLWAAAAVAHTGDDAELGPQVELRMRPEALPLLIDAWGDAAERHGHAALWRRRAGWCERVEWTATARSDWRRACDADPRHGPSWRARLRLAEQASDSTEALACLEALGDLADGPADQRALAARRGTLLADLGRSEAAIEAWTAARCPEEPAAHARALDALIRLYDAAEMAAELTAALREREAIAALAGDPLAGALAARRATLAEAHNRISDAISAWERALELGHDPQVTLAALEPLYAIEGRVEDQAAVLARRIELASGAQRRALRAQRARLLDGVGDLDGALAEWDATLAEAPGHTEALWAARDLRVERADWAEAIDLGARLLASLAGHDPRFLTLARSQARALAGPLDRPPAAIAAWAAVLDHEPGDDEALDALEALYTRVNEPAGLVGILERRRARAESPDGALIRRIGALRADDLDDPDGALAAFDAALALDPTDAEAFARAAAILDGRGDGAGVLDRIERHVPHAPQTSALALHAEAAGRAEGLGRPSVALGHLAAAMRLGGDDALFGPTAERLAGEGGEWPALAAAWQASLDEVRGTPAALPLHRRLLGWARGPLVDTAAALRHAAGVLALDPADVAALETRVESSAEPGVVADALSRLYAVDETPAVRVRRARRLGALHAGPLGDTARAVEWFERALEIDAADREALAGLAEVHRAAENWPALRIVRLRQADLARVDREAGRARAEVQVALLAEAARLSAALGAPGQALDDWTEVLVVDRHHAEGLQAARTLHRAAGDWAATVDLGARLLDGLAADGDDAGEREGLLRDQARIIDDRLDQRRAAVVAWRALLATTPDDGEALAALDRLFAAAGEPGELAEILAARTRLTPDETGLWIRLGIARRAVGDLDRAQAAFDTALALDPTDEDAFEAGLALADGPVDVLDRIEAHLAHRAADAAVDEPPTAVIGLHGRALDAAIAASDDRAAAHLAVVIRATADDARFGPIAERIGRGTGQWSPLVDAWTAAIERAGRSESRPLRRRVLRWLAAHGTADAARPHAEALLIADPDDVESLSALTRVSDPRTRADALARLHPLLDDPQARAERAMAVAAVYADELGDPRGAIGWYEAALADRVDDPTLLAALARAHTALGDRFALCRTRRRQAAAARGVERIELRADAARLATELGDPHAARDWAAVLTDAPEHREALEAARRIELDRGDARAAATLGDRLLGVLATDDPTRLDLLRAQARQATSSGGRPERAIDLWKALLEHVTGDAEALDALQGLYGAAGDAHGRLWVLEHRRAGAPAPGLLVASGDIRRLDLGDERGALADYDAALNADPLHGEAFDRACLACAALGDRAGELDRIEDRLERVEDPASQAELRCRAAELAERLQRSEAALRHWSIAARISGDDARFAAAVERLAAETGDWATPAAAWRAGLSGRSAGAALPLRRRLLSWACGPLDDAAEARVHAEHILTADPEDRAALHAMADAAATPAERGEALSRLYDLVEDPATRGALARDLGRLHAADAPGRATRWFEAALAVEPHDREALRGLADVHRAREAWAPLLAVRLQQANAEGDPRRLIEAAALAEQLGRPADAVDHWRRALDTSADMPDGAVDRAEGLRALDRLLDAQGRWAELDAVLAERIAGAPDEARRALWVRRAHLAAERLHDPAAALAGWRAILALDPDDDEALWAALALSEGSDRTALRRGLVERLPAGEPRRVTLLRALAREAAPASRARAWEAVLRDAPQDAEALDALEASYEQDADWAALVRILGERQPADAGRLLRIARLRDERLGDPRAAAEAYDALIELTPEDDAAFGRLIELRIAASQYAAALRRIESRLAWVKAPAARLALRRQAADLAENRLDRAADALAHVVRAFAESGDDARFGPEAARLAQRVEDWSRPVAAWTAAIDGAPAATALALHLRIGGWAAGPMGDAALARHHYRATLAIEPEHREALRALAALAEDRPADRAEALEGLLHAESDPEARRVLALRLGDLYAGPLAEPDRAVARYCGALVRSLDDISDAGDSPAVDAEALAGLARVHAGRGAWAPLLAVRARQISALHGAARAAMRVEMARLAERLGRVDAAIETWDAALDEGADPHGGLAALDALLTAERRWAPLADVLERRVAQAAGDRAALRALHIRLAGLHAERLNDPAGARRHWQAVLALDPADVEALWASRALADAPAERVDVNRRLLATLPPADAGRGALCREIARLCGQPRPVGLDRPDEAINAWRAILEVTPGDAEALDALETLHGASGADPAALVEVLRLRHAAAPSTALSLRIGALLEGSGQAAGALSEYRAVLAEVPDHAEAFARARRLMLAEGHQDELLALVEDRLAHVAEPAARRALADEAARLAEDGGAVERALHWLGEAFAACRDDAAYGDAMARLAAAADNRSVAIDRWTAAAEALADTAEAVPLHLRLHAWLASDDPARSAAELARAARIAPDDRRVLRAQSRSAEESRDHGAMLRALIALRRQTPAASTRLDLTRRIARLLAGPLDNPDAALAEYVRLLGERPDDGEALAQRADLLRRLDRPGDLFEVIGELLERDMDPARRRALLEERAALAERLGRTDAAIESWRAALASGPAAGRDGAAWSALETLYTADGRLEDLEALLVDRAADAEPAAAAGFHMRAAQLAEARGDAAAVQIHCEAALDADPDCAPALRVLAALHAGAGDTATQARLEARLAAGLPEDTPEAIDRWRAIGRLCQGALGDPAQAIDAWTQVRRIVPDDEEALGALSDLYAVAGDDAALADVLDRRAVSLAGRGEKRALLIRVGELRERVGDLDGAIGAWNAVFQLDPTADEPFEALERLLERRGDWPALAGLMLDRAAALPVDGRGARRQALRLRAADLLAGRAERPAAALAARLSVFAEQPDDGAHGAIIEALAEAADDHRAAAAAYEAALDRGLPVERAVPLRMRLARWQSTRLAAPEDAIAQYCAVLDRVPDHAEALARMETLRVEVGDWSALASLLQQRVARATGEADRLSALRRLGRVQARQTEAAQAAIATWRRIRRAVPADAEAAEALVRLYRDAEQWPALVRLLEELPPEPARLRDIARLCLTALDDRERAIDALERARVIDPDDAETADALVPAYRAAERWTDLRGLYLDLVRRRPPAARAELYRGLAHLLEGPLAERDAAADAWRSILRWAPTDAEAIAELDRLERAAGRLAPLADAWASHVAALPAEQSVDARLTLAALHRALGDPYRAIDTLRPALDLPRSRGDALRQLAVLYAETGDWRYCADALDREIRTAGPAERLIRLREAADIRERHLRDPLGAFERIADAWRLAPADEALAADAARLGNRVGRPRALLDLNLELEGRIPAVEIRGRVLRATARLARGLDESEAEATAWRTLHDAVDPDDREALDGLIRLLTRSEAWSALRPALEARMALDPTPAGALALGVLTAEHLDRPGEAAGWYRRALALDPHDRRALAGLVDIERSREAWPALYHALDRLAETLDDAAEADVRAEQATLATARLGRPADARRLWTAVLALRGGYDTAALSALDRLLVEGAAPGDDDALVAVLERRIDAGEPPAPLHVRLARLHAARGRSAEALRHWRWALDAEPDCAPALWAVHQGSTDAAEVVTIRRRLLARLGADDPRRIELLRAHARHAEQAEGLAAAVAGWRAVRAEAALDVEAVEALVRLYDAQDDRAALADILAETGVDRLRAARLYVELGHPRIARRLFERILETEPGQREASEALADMHRAALRWPALATVLGGRLAATRDADERDGLRRRLAEVQHRRLRAPEAALSTLLAAFDARPDPTLIPQLQALAAETDDWPALADSADRALRALDGGADVALASALHGWLTSIYADRLDMPQAAVVHARRAWRLDDDDARRVRLEELLTAVEDWEGLADVWARHADRLPAAEQRDRLAALARLHAERRGDPAAAAAVWQDVLAADPTDAEALDALTVLHRETDRLADLCAVLERRFEQATALGARVELAEQIADIAAGALGDPQRAIGPMRAVVDATGRPALYARLAELQTRAGHPSAAMAVRLEALRRLPTPEARARALVALADDLREPGRALPWRGLRMAYADDDMAWHAVNGMLDAVGRWDDRVALATLDADAHGGRDRWAEVARLHQDRRRDPLKALAAWSVALVGAAGETDDDAILDAIEAIHRAGGRLDRFAAVLEDRIDRVPAPDGFALALRLADVQTDRLDPAAVAEALTRALALRDGSSDGGHAIGDAMPDAIGLLDRMALAYAAADDWVACHAAGRDALARAAAGMGDGSDGNGGSDGAMSLAEQAGRRLMLTALAARADGAPDDGDPWEALYAEIIGGPLFEPVLDRLARSAPARWRRFARRHAQQIDDGPSWARLARGLSVDRPDRAAAAWLRVLDHEPTHAEALAWLAARDRSTGQDEALVARQIAAAAADPSQLDGLRTLADDPTLSPEASHSALEALYAADPRRTPLDRLAMARLAVGDTDGWRSMLDAARRVEADPAAWAARTVALADAGRDWPGLIADRVDAAGLDALDEALAVAGRWTDVAELRALRLDDTAERQADYARVCARLGRVTEAFEGWRAVLAAAPGDPEALDGVAALEADLPAARVVGIYAEQAPQLAEATARRAFAARIADLVDQLADRQPALDALAAAVARDTDGPLMERLAVLRAEAGDDAGAAEMWARALDAVDVNALDAPARARRLGTLADLRSRAGDLDGAFAAVAEAVARDPDSDREDARLARLADATGRPAERAAALDRARRATADVDRRAALGELLAELFRGPLADTDAAEAFWRDRLRATPGEAAALGALIERLQGAERWGDLAALYAERAHVMPAEAAGLHTARARIFADRLGDPAAEAEAWRAVRAAEPRNLKALEALWTLEGDAEARDGLARALLARVPAADPLRLALHRWLAPRVEPAAAAEHWRAVLAQDPAADDAADALEALRRAAGDHDAVRALLDRKLDRVDGAEAEAEVWRAIAAVEALRGDGAATRGAWRAVLSRLSGDPQAEAALSDAHLAADDVEAWAAMRLERLETTVDPAVRAELYREVAGVLEARLPDAGPAFEVIGRAFAERPHDGALAGELARLAGRTGQWAALADRWRAGLAGLEGLPAVTLALRIAELEQRHGRMDAAADAWRRALAIDAYSIPALEGLEQHAIGRGDDAALAEILAARLRTPASEAEALDRWRRLAQLRWGAGQTEAAEAAWHAVLQRHPDDSEALGALEAIYTADGQWRALTEVLVRQLMSAEGAREVAVRQRLAAVSLTHLDDRATARSALDPIAAQTDDPAILGLLVELTRAEGDWPACAAALDRQARHSSGAAARDAWITKGEIQRDRLDDVPGARASFAAAAEIDPRHRATLEALWTLAEQVGDAPAAARALSRLEPLGDPGERAVWLTRLGELEADALGEPAGAVEAWQQALAADPGHGPALRRLAEHALDARRWPEAAVLLDRLIAAEPEAEPSRMRARHLAAARCAEALDDDDGARRHYEAALAIDGTHRPALLALCDLAFRQGDWGRAFRVGQALLVHHGDGFEAAERADRLHRLGALKALLGEPERAEAFYRQALSAWPGHGPSRRALAASDGPLPTAPVDEDPSWIGAADLVDAEDAALEAYLYGDGPAPDLDGLDDGFESVDAPSAGPPPLPADIRQTGTYASPMVHSLADFDMQGTVERAVQGPLERAVERIVERIGERPVEVTTRFEGPADPGVAAAARAAESAAAEATAAARAAESAAEAAHAGAAAMQAFPLAAAAALQAPGGELRARGPVRPIKASKVRVLRRTSPRRRYLYVGLAASVLIAGLTAGLFAVQSYRLEQTTEDNARLARVSQSLARRVSATQLAFERVTRELKGEEIGPDAPLERAIALFDDEGQPLDEVMLELAFRDLEMREELGAVKDILASADASRENEVERSKTLEMQVATLESRIGELKAQQTEVHSKLAGRLDQNIQAIETALTATGIDFNALANPELGKTPIVVAGLDDAPLTGAGGPFIAEGTSEYVNPVPGETEVMSGFGPRGHTHHNGIDIPAPIGTAVLAVNAGKIIHVQDRAAWQGRSKWATRDGVKTRSQGHRAGVYVELEQDDGRVSRYMHLSAVAPGVEVGSRVQKGQVLGSVGRTGVERSETHLHFELREQPTDGERFGAALDPTAAVHGDDADVIMGTSLLHADPSLIEISPAAERALKTRQAVGGADDEVVVAQLDGRMDRLQNLEKLLREMPLVPPVDDFRVTSRFGRRLDPINGEWGFHGGLDIPGAEGSPIRATAPGTVVSAGTNGRYGVMVEIDHGNGVTTRYGHLLRSLVRPGQRVRYRARIGEMGSSGRTTGVHVHYEVRVDGQARDPMNFIQAGRYVFKR